MNPVLPALGSSLFLETGLALAKERQRRRNCETRFSRVEIALEDISTFISLFLQSLNIIEILAASSKRL